ncbi:hypothetical protein KKF91_20120 [Myxococcota bacterium]|nr:hypothetical protein [Myxococcota bacterium]MBU1432853.1 hypothetical protein [Myxococcota bacterium]MBU1897537.1 hypothetical protein [Myxococcota bacterium]
MNIIIGDYPSQTSFDTQLTLTFYPGEFQVHWRRAALTADFVASWFSEAGEGVADAISYALNELVENAIKFGEAGRIEVTVGLIDADLMMIVNNHLPREGVPKLEGLLREMVEEDPWELIVRRVEANAADPNSSQSGLGFLTLLTDYSAQLGWSITADEASSQASLSTVVCLKTHEG